MKRLVLAVVAAMSALAPAQPVAQQAGQVAPPAAARAVSPDAAPTATIRGRILLGDGRPARRASVRLTRLGTPGPFVVSADLSGRYEFTRIPDGEYRLSAGKPGYLPLEYGQRRAQEPGVVLSVKAGDALDNVDVTLPSSGSVSGRVLDENGDPVEAVVVQLMQSVFAGNRRQLVPVAGIGGRPTDDQGHYRLYAVPPGQYVVVARLTDSELPRTVAFRPADTPLPPGYATTFFAGAANASRARAIAVGVSEDIANIDIPLARIGSARVSGIVFDSAGRPVVASVSLLPSARSGGSVMAEWLNRNSSADGTFDIGDVPPGEWVLQASAGVTLSPGTSRPTAEGEFAAQTISVGQGGLHDLHVQMSAGSRASGHVLFDGAAPQDLSAFAIGTLPADPDRTAFKSGVVVLPNGIVSSESASPIAAPATASAPVQADGTFDLAWLNGPRRFRLARAPASWSIKEITVNGRDVTDEALLFGRPSDSLTGIEVVLTNRAGSIAGRVIDDRGQPATDFAVTVFAAESDRWYQGSRFLGFARAAADGTFEVTNLPPGNYYVAATTGIQGNATYGDWQDPEVLAALATRAMRVFLNEGQAVSLALRLIASAR